MKRLILSILFLLSPLSAAESWQIVYYGAYQPSGEDRTILDLFEHSARDASRAKFPIAYFSAHYENWRPDAKDFGRKLGKIGGWKGEYYVDWKDPRNQQVMKNRLYLAKKKGFLGVDIDNVDGPDGFHYFPWLFDEAKKMGLRVGLKNFVEILPEFGDKVDFFVSEATEREELQCYERYRKPVVRMYYGRGAKTPAYIFQVRSGQGGNRF